MARKEALVTLILLASVGVSLADLTIEQLVQMGSLMQQTCLNLVKVSPEHHAMMQEGKFPDDKDAKCWLNCMFEKMGAMKRGKMQIDFAMKQINSMFPADMKEPSINAMQTCKDAGKGTKDPCEVSYKIADCFGGIYPDFFMLFKG